MKKLLSTPVLILLIIVGVIFVGCTTPATPTSTTPSPTTKPTATTSVPTVQPTATTSIPTTSAPVQPTVIKLGFASEKAATHYDMLQNFPGFFNLVEKATNGKYKLNMQYYPVGTLLASTEIYDGVVSGIVDIGQSSFGYTPGRFPVMVTLLQPGVAPTANCDAAGNTILAFYNQFKPKELADTHPIYFYGTGPGYMHNNKKIQAVSDMKGLRIRVTGGGVRAVQLVGGDPLAVPMAEVYEAAKKGLIDALVSPPETLEGWKHAELFKSSTSVPYFYSEYFFVTMNLDKWNSLPKDLQDAFNSVQAAGVAQADAIWQYQQKHAMDYATALPGGHEFLTLPADEVTKLQTVLQPIRGEYVTMLNGKGLNGEQLATAAASLAAAANQKTYTPWTPK
jgi:TRAP-type transport system periplasmic protein